MIFIIYVIDKCSRRCDAETPITDLIMTYQVITIDRNKNVVRTTVVNTWTNALETVRHGMLLARDDKWVVYPQGSWEAPRYAKGLNGCYTTSFGMAKRNEVGQSSYFFTYIKKAV